MIKTKIHEILHPDPSLVFSRQRSRSTGGRQYVRVSQRIEISFVQNPGWLFYIEDYTTQFYRDDNKPLKGSLLPNQYNGIS